MTVKYGDDQDGSGTLNTFKQNGPSHGIRKGLGTLKTEREIPCTFADFEHEEEHM